MPKKLTPYQWKNMLFSYEVIYNAILNDPPTMRGPLDDWNSDRKTLARVHYLLRVRAGGLYGSEATEETDRTSEPDETERGGVAGAGH